MGNHRPRGRFPGHRRVGLSKLFSIPECAQHGTAGLPPGERLQPRLEPGAAGSRKLVRQRGLNQILLDEYGFSEPTAYVPQAQMWSCQEPSPGDAGRWAVFSANNIADGSYCPWLMRYPHQALAGGSMYAIQLPSMIPAAGTPGGPTLPEDSRYFGGAPGFDVRVTFLKCIRDPQQLQPTLDRMQAMWQAGAQ